MSELSQSLRAMNSRGEDRLGERRAEHDNVKRGVRHDLFKYLSLAPALNTATTATHHMTRKALEQSSVAASDPLERGTVRFGKTNPVNQRGSRREWQRCWFFSSESTSPRGA